MTSGLPTMLLNAFEDAGFEIWGGAHWESGNLGTTLVAGEKVYLTGRLEDGTQRFCSLRFETRDGPSLSVDDWVSELGHIDFLNSNFVCARVAMYKPRLEIDVGSSSSRLEACLLVSESNLTKQALSEFIAAWCHDVELYSRFPTHRHMN